MTNEDERQIKGQLEKDLRVHVPDVVWRRLLREGCVRAVYTGGDVDSWQELKGEAQSLLEVWRDGRDGAAGSTAPPDLRLERTVHYETDHYTRQRGDVFVELASARRDVQRFRQQYLRGRLLSDGEVDEFVRDQGSVRARRAVAQLERLSKKLAHSYAWSERAARRFLLTGRAPEPVSVTIALGQSSRASVPNTSRITVSADAWVDEGEVARAYKAARRSLLGGRSRKRPDRSLEVVRFVARQIREHDGQRPPWSKLVERWNQEYPHWRYKDHQGRKLAQTFGRFVHPKHERQSRNHHEEVLSAR